MGNVWSGDKIYFDELSYGIGVGLNFDDGLNWDAEYVTVVLITVDITTGTEAYFAHEILDIDIVFDVTETENNAKYIDLMELIPSKFRQSLVLRQFLDVIGLDVGTWLGEINDLEKLLDKYSVSDTYLQKLADLLGYTIIMDDTTPTEDKRRQLIQAIDWYKMKGTYQSLAYISYLLGLHLTMRDMYTYDYINFYKEAWFVGNTTEDMPIDLPHLDLRTKLLLHCDGTNLSTAFPDSALSPHAVTAHNHAHLVTAIKKFGTASGIFDGTDDYLTVADSVDWSFGIQDFTIDFWVRFSSITNGFRFMGQLQDGSHYWYVGKDTNANGNKLFMFFRNGSNVGSYEMTNAWSGLATDTWYHIVYERAGVTGRIFIDGIAQDLTETVAFGTNNMGDFNSVLYIGQLSGYYHNGWLDEIRVSKGIARWDGDFTPFTRQYQDYYKSPHFGVEVNLNQVYGVSPNKHLFYASTFDTLASYVERTRPVNTVPHYDLFLNPITDETGDVTEVPGEIKTCVLGAWTFSRIYFDDGHMFDDGEFFDYTETSFLESIVKWKLGIGNKEVTPGPGFTLQSVVLTGDISRVQLFNTYAEYEFELPNISTQQGLSELGLFLVDGTTMEIASTFPDIDLTVGVALRIVVRLYY